MQKVVLILTLFSISISMISSQENSDCCCSYFKEIERAIECLGFRLSDHIAQEEDLKEIIIQIDRNGMNKLTKYSIDKIVSIIASQISSDNPIKIFDPILQRRNNEIKRGNQNDGIEIVDSKTQLGLN